MEERLRFVGRLLDGEARDRTLIDDELWAVLKAASGAGTGRQAQCSRRRAQQDRGEHH
jgi:hypothetical protein